MNNVALGLGNPEDPLYGVFDTELNFFYLVSCHLEIIEKAVTLLLHHRTVSPMLISDSANWYHTLIDNSVCSNWGITYDPIKTCINNVINHSEETYFLINNLQYFLEIYEKIVYIKQTLHSRCQEWIMLNLPPDELSQQFVNDPWVQFAITRELDNYDYAYAKFEHELSNIISVFELDINTYKYSTCIESKLATLSIDPTISCLFKELYEF